MKSALATKEPMSDDVLFGRAMFAGMPTASRKPRDAPRGFACSPLVPDGRSVALVAESDEGVGQRIYAGHEYDVATGLSYMGARYYDASTGRFLSQDPISSAAPEKYLDDPQRFNMYAYARNNPLNRIDPTGLYDTKTGVIEKGDTSDSITSAVNDALHIKTDWATIANVSFFQDNFSTTNPSDLVGHKTYVGSDHVTDVTQRLNALNESRANMASAAGPAALALFAPNGPWDLKNSSDPVFGVKNSSYDSYIYNGGLIRYDAPGNINYGYVSRAAGLNGSTIQFGATLAQVGDNLAHGRFSASDNGGDAAYVNMGIKSYAESRPLWLKIIDSFLH